MTTVRLLQINIGGIAGKERALTHLFIKYNIDICIICEIKTSHFKNTNQTPPPIHGYSCQAESLRCAIYYKTSLQSRVSLCPLNIDQPAHLLASE